MNKTQTWKFLADRKIAEFNELDTERRELVNTKTLIEEKISFVEQIIEEHQDEVNYEDAVFRLDGMHKTRQVYLSQLRNIRQGLVTKNMDMQLKLSRILHEMQLLQIEKQRYEKLADLSSKKLDKFHALLEQKESDRFAIQNFLQRRKLV